MTNEQWKDAEKRLQGYLGRACFRIDGYDISVSRKLDHLDHLIYMIWVNGEFRGIWKENDPECFKFQNRITHRVYNKKLIDIMRKCKAYPKAEIDEKEKELRVHFSPIYQTFATLKKTLIANNTSIQLLND